MGLDVDGADTEGATLPWACAVSKWTIDEIGSGAQVGGFRGTLRSKGWSATLRERCSRRELSVVFARFRQAALGISVGDSGLRFLEYLPLSLCAF